MSTPTLIPGMVRHPRLDDAEAVVAPRRPWWRPAATQPEDLAQTTLVLLTARAAAPGADLDRALIRAARLLRGKDPGYIPAHVAAEPGRLCPYRRFASCAQVATHRKGNRRVCEVHA